MGASKRKNITQQRKSKKDKLIPYLQSSSTSFTRQIKKCNDPKNQYLIEQNAIDFDDILFYAYPILSENPSVVHLHTSLYKFVCVDEAQDLNFLQYEVIKVLCGKDFKNIMLVGDEKQSIYGFNGSDSRLMTDSFVKDFSPVVYSLNENFRSAKSFVAYANKIEQSDSVSNYYYDGEIKAFSFSDEKEEALFILEHIQQLLQFGHKDIENNLEYNNFAIIARNKYVFREIESLLRQKQIPFYYKNTISGIDNESDYMKVFDLSMRMLINPKDIIHLRELKKLLNVSMDKIGEFDTGLELLHDLFENSSYFDMLMALKDISGDNFDFSKALGIINAHISGTLNISDEEKYLVCNDVKQWQIHWKKYTSMIQ